MSSDTPTSPATSEHVASLRELRLDLLRLHKALLDAERVRFEREHGRVEDGAPLWHLVTRDPSFAWIRPLTTLIVGFDEKVDGKEPLSGADAGQLLEESRVLLAPNESGDDFQRNYDRVIHANPDALFEHAKTVRRIGRIGK